MPHKYQNDINNASVLLASESYDIILIIKVRY